LLREDNGVIRTEKATHSYIYRLVITDANGAEGIVAAVHVPNVGLNTVGLYAAKKAVVVEDPADIHGFYGFTQNAVLPVASDVKINSVEPLAIAVFCG
jgi:hypothetical protein